MSSGGFKIPQTGEGADFETKPIIWQDFCHFHENERDSKRPH